MVHQGNLRWDTLQRRVAAILRRLRVRTLTHFVLCYLIYFPECPYKPLSNIFFPLSLSHSAFYKPERGV